MELDQFDLKFNFGCASCGYKNKSENAPLGTIPVSRVIDKLDALFSRNDMTEAGKLLDYWRKEAVSLRDMRGELTIVSEQMGYFRKTGEEEKAMESVDRGLELIEMLNAADSVPSATIFLNAATTLKAFGKAEKALPLYAQTQRIYTKKLDKNNLLFAGFYNNYGLALVDLNRYEEAEAAYQKALEIVLNDPKGRLDGAVTYLNMAHLYEVWDDKTAADIKLCLKNAKEILEEESIPKNGYYAFVLSKCAPTYRHFGKIEIAENMEHLSEEIYERN